MKIFKEKTLDNTYSGKVVLENGIALYVSTNGYADGSDGQRYVGVFREDECGDWVPIGWTPDASASVLIQ